MRDIGSELKTAAHMTALVRTRQGMHSSRFLPFFSFLLPVLSLVPCFGRSAIASKYAFLPFIPLLSLPTLVSFSLLSFFFFGPERFLASTTSYYRKFVSGRPIYAVRNSNSNANRTCPYTYAGRFELESPYTVAPGKWTLEHIQSALEASADAAPSPHSDAAKS